MELGETYSSGEFERGIVAVSDEMPSCSYFRGNFTINPGGTWNGISLANVGGPRENLLVVRGTPSKAGRVRVHLELVNVCASPHDIRFIGYSEVIVVDPNEE